MDVGDAVRPRPAARAGEGLDSEHPSEEFGPGDPGPGEEADAGPWAAGTAGGLQTFPLGNDGGTPVGVRGKDPVIVDGVAAWWRYQGGELLRQLVGLEEDVGGHRCTGS